MKLYAYILKNYFGNYVMNGIFMWGRRWKEQKQVDLSEEYVMSRHEMVMIWIKAVKKVTEVNRLEVVYTVFSTGVNVRG